MKDDLDFWLTVNKAVDVCMMLFVLLLTIAFGVACWQWGNALKSARQWEQLYRDCQVARQFSEPAHAADAVNDVTR